MNTFLHSSTIRLSLTKKADKLACSFQAEHVRIVVISKRSTLQKLGDALMGRPDQYALARLTLNAA